MSGRAGLIVAVDAHGRVPQATFIPSPNCDDRPDGAGIHLVVVHGIFAVITVILVGLAALGVGQS